jgi:hypothetical protein
LLLQLASAQGVWVFTITSSDTLKSLLGRNLQQLRSKLNQIKLNADLTQRDPGGNVDLHGNPYTNGTNKNNKIW